MIEFVCVVVVKTLSRIIIFQCVQIGIKLGHPGWNKCSTVLMLTVVIHVVILCFNVNIALWPNIDMDGDDYVTIIWISSQSMMTWLSRMTLPSSSHLSVTSPFYCVFHCTMRFYHPIRKKLNLKYWCSHGYENIWAKVWIKGSLVLYSDLLSVMFC